MASGSQLAALPAPSVTELAMGALSASPSGVGVLADAVVGGVAGYVVAPADKKILYSSIVAVSSGFAGVLGLVASAGYLYWRQK